MPEHLKQQFGAAEVHSVGQRYSFDDSGNMTGQAPISGMGGNELGHNNTMNNIPKLEMPEIT